MAVRIDDPIDDPKLPSYRHPTLRELQAELKLAGDCWEDLRGGLIRDYLPKEEAEPDDAYKARLGRTAYRPLFRQAIEGFCGVLTRYQLNEPPETWEDMRDDIDLEGNSEQAFWAAADALALRDGGCLITVDMPPGESTSRAEELAEGRRPYLALHQRSHMVNWRLTTVNGVEVPAQVTVLELAEVEDGEFGVKTETRYRIHGPGAWRLVTIDRASNGEVIVQQLEEGTYLDADRNPLPFPPVVWYPAEMVGFGRGALPLRQLALMTIEHLQKRSDLAEKTHKCALPVPVRTGVAPEAPGSRAKPLVLGPNTVVDVPAGGTFGWAEPSASSLAEQRTQIAELEAAMRDFTVNFLQGSSAKTATQAGLEATQTQASIQNLARQKNSAMQRAMAIWALFTGDTLAEGAGIVMSPTIYDRPLEAADVSQLVTMDSNGQISRRSFFEELIKGGRLTTVTSADDELQRMADEAAALNQQTQEQAPPVPRGEDLAEDDIDLPGSDQVTGQIEDD